MFTGEKGVSSVQGENGEAINSTSNATTSQETNTQTQTTEVENENVVKPKETARESVERALKEEREKAERSGNESNQADKANEDKTTVKPTQNDASKPDEDEHKFDPELSPPERFRAHEKEMFNNLPVTLKRALNRSVKNLESMTFSRNQEYVTKSKEYEAIDEVIKPHLAGWQQMGYTKSQAIAQLIGTQQKLTDPDPKVRKETLKWLAHHSEIDLKDLTSEDSGGGTPKSEIDIANHPEIKALREDLKRVSSIHDQKVAETNQQQIDHATAEFRAVKNETDSSGKYRYPELHDDEFLERLRPSILTVLGTVPGLSYGEAMKRAYFAMTGKNPGASVIQGSIGSQNNNSQVNNRAYSAAVSVRGNSAPGTALINGEIPPEALKSSQASVKWALETLRRG